MGVAGAALALNITYCTNFIIQEVYVRLISADFEKYYQGTRLFSKETFEGQGWCTFLKLGVPGTAM